MELSNFCQTLILALNKLQQQEVYQDQQFRKKLSVVAQSLQNQDNQKQIDIELEKLFKFIDSEYIKIQHSEENKALIALKQPKVHRMYVDGCFDLMHSGHYNALRQAKQLCEVLVCGVIASEEIDKRKGTPIMTLEERASLIVSCKWVDEVYLGAPYDPTIELIDKLNCSHVGHGDDLILTPDGKDAYSPFKDTGRMKIFKRTEGISTTDIVGRLLLMSKNVSDYDNKIIRKMSGDQGIQVSSFSKQEEQKMDTIQPQTEEIDSSKVTKVKLLNSTRRIREFSQGNKEPKSDDVIVYLDGAFDMLHMGHIDMIKKAKELGTYLIVGVYDDETINQRKGQNYPVLNLYERVLNILALKYVDDVIIGAPQKITENMIKQLNISIVVQGTATEGLDSQNLFDNPYEYAIKLGKYKTLPSTTNLTTEKLIERIIENRKKYLDIYNKKSKKQEDYYDNTKREVQEL